MRHARAQRDLRKMVVAELSPRGQARVLDHLTSCGECRGYYERLLSVDAALAGVDFELTPGQVDRIGKRLEASIGEPSRRSHGPLAVWAAALATTAAGLFFFLGPNLQEEFQARGLLPGNEGQVTVRVHCMSKGDQPEVRGVYPAPRLTWRSLRNRCTIEDVLSFSYAAGEDPSGFLFVVGIDEQLQPLWYHPIPREQRSLAVIPDVADHALPGAVNLAQNHRPGRLRIAILTSEEPLSVEQVRRAIGDREGMGASLGSLANRLSEDVRQSIIEIHLESDR